MIPTGRQWQYEPKWDGFRCLLSRDGDTVAMYSKSGQDLSRYFPEVAAAALLPIRVIAFLHLPHPTTDRLRGTLFMPLPPVPELGNLDSL